MRRASSLSLAVVLASGCFHDFDEPFSGSGGSAGAGEGATGGDGAGVSTGASNAGGDGAGGSSMTGLPEDCANGADDDGDSLVDCDDAEDCPDLTCITHPGEGWEGPLVLYVGALEGAPSCPDASEPVVDQGATIVTPAATCNTNCNCSSPQGGACGAVTITAHALSNCGGAGTVVITMEDELCHDQELGSPLGLGFKSNIITATGSCTPFGTQPNIQDASLSEWGRACDVGTGGTCGVNGVCAERAAAPFQEGTVCFGRTGDHECPAGLANKRTLHTSVTDERICAPCSCDPATGRTCDGQLHIYAEASCSNNKADLMLDGECDTDIDVFMPSSYRFELNNPQGGSCSPSGGTVTGDVLTEGDYTVCCSGPSN